MSSPRISIVIPAKNAGKFLAETLRSVKQQQCDIHELIVVDDGSTDDTGSIAKDFGAQLFVTPGIGNAAALNLGIERSTGELIAHFDADDIMLPDKLATQLRPFLDDPQESLGLVSSDLRMFDNDSGSKDEMTFLERRPRFQQLLSSQDDNQLLRLTPTESASLQAHEYFVDIKSLYRRDAWEQIGGFNTSYRCVNDMEFVWRLSRHYDIAVIPRVLILGRRHANSLSSNPRLIASECSRLFREMLTDIDSPAERQILRTRIKRELFDLAWLDRHEGRWLSAAGRYLRGMVA